MLPKLKALQVSDNPLVYPSRKVIVEGTKAIKAYLKKQFEKLAQQTDARPRERQASHRNRKEEEKEELINVKNYTSSEESVSVKPKYSKTNKESYKDIKETIKKKMSDPRGLQPTLKVKKLSRTNIPKTPEKIENEGKRNEPLKIVHKITRSGNTISLVTSLDRVGIRNDFGKIAESGLKEGWLNQLRLILSDQERILQQERYFIPKYCVKCKSHLK